MEKSIILEKGREASVQRFHPWIFSGAIKSRSGEMEDGDLVTVTDVMGQHLGKGHYQKHGSISVRLLTFNDEIINDLFWENKIRHALSLRKELNITHDKNNCFRLIHGEGDGLPGLIIDIYGQAAVIQCHSMGMYQTLDLLKRSLMNVMGDQLSIIYNKSANTLPGGQSIHSNTFLLGDRPYADVWENGHLFRVNWVEGQKTGFFLDQRENRVNAGKIARNRKVFNTFSYTGGFSVYALSGGASQVTSIDSSQIAIDMVEKNVELNNLDASGHKSVRSDVMVWLKTMKKDSFDFGIVDPPAYAKTHNARHKALMAYKRLNAAALNLIAPGGYMMTFSCSQAVDSAAFRSMIYSSGIEAGRQVSILKQLSQGPDHPVNLYHPEGEYLKGLLLRID